MTRNNRPDEYLVGEEDTEALLDRRYVVKTQYAFAYPDEWVRMKDVKLCFLLANGKNGTTTIDRLFNLSEDIASYHELAPRMWHIMGDAVRHPESDIWPYIYWSARRDVISTVNSLGLTFGEMNHRLWPLASHIVRTMPNTKFIFTIRPLDHSVRSMVNWGLYSHYDKNLEGRLFNESITDTRLQCAWAWCEVNEKLLLFARFNRDKVFYLPFDAIKNKDIEKILSMYDFCSLTRPEGKHIEYVLDQTYNVGDKVEVEKNWQGFEDRESKIFETIKEIFGE